MKIGGIAQLVRRLVQRLLLQAIALLLARLALLLAGGALLLGTLLLLGLALGADDRLMSQMDTIGARGIFISLCCVAGSLIGARLLEPIMNRHVGRYAVSRTAKDEGAAQ